MSSVTKQSKGKKSAVESAFSERINGVSNSLIGSGCATPVIDEVRRLMIDIYNNASDSEKTVNELNKTLKKYKKDNKSARTLTAYQLYCKSITESVKNDFIASCPHVVENVTDEKTNEVRAVDMIEYTDSKGMKKRCVATGAPITVLQSVFSAKWKALSADAKSPFYVEASRLKAEADAVVSSSLKAVSNGDSASDSGDAVGDSVTASAVTPTVTSDSTARKRKSKKDATPAVAPVTPAVAPVTPAVAPVTPSATKKRTKKAVAQPDALPAL